MRRSRAGCERAAVAEAVNKGPSAPVPAKLESKLFDAQLAATTQASFAQGMLRSLHALACPASAITILTLPQPTDHYRPLASIPASPAENDVALSRHCAGCRPHPPTRGTEDLRSCCCALQARAEHRVIMLTRRRAVSMLPSAVAAPPSASTTELRSPAVHTLRTHTVPGRRALFWPQSGRIRVSGCRGR